MFLLPAYTAVALFLCCGTIYQLSSHLYSHITQENEIKQTAGFEESSYASWFNYLQTDEDKQQWMKSLDKIDNYATETTIFGYKAYDDKDEQSSSADYFGLASFFGFGNDRETSTESGSYFRSWGFGGKTEREEEISSWSSYFGYRKNEEESSWFSRFGLLGNAETPSESWSDYFGFGDQEDCGCHEDIEDVVFDDKDTGKWDKYTRLVSLLVVIAFGVFCYVKIIEKVFRYKTPGKGSLRNEKEIFLYDADFAICN